LFPYYLISKVAINGKTFEADLAAAAAESDHAVESKEKFARALKYILPSYWIPGKQKGGAF
jgi:hypothetical protein